MDVGVTAFLHDGSISPARFAAAAEERGFRSLYLPEHTHLPVAEAAPPGLVAGVTLEDYRRSLDPMVALATAAAVTRSIRLGTGVCLVAQHDPVVLAKQLATLDQLSGGRVVFGVGYGWNRREAADHGVDFAARREVAREKLLCMQALWGMEEAEYHGRYVELPPCYSWPKPRQGPRVLTVVGAGPGQGTFETVSEIADGWMPIGGAGIAEALPRLRDTWSRAGRDGEPLHVIAFGTVPDEAKLDHLRRSGVTEVVLRVPSGTDGAVLRVLDDYTRYLAPA